MFWLMSAPLPSDMHHATNRDPDRRLRLPRLLPLRRHPVLRLPRLPMMRATEGAGHCPRAESLASLDAPHFLDTPPLFLDLLPLMIAILALLPVDTRMRCSEVNRAWRALLSDTSFWEHLDLRPSSGLTRCSEALLRAAVAKAMSTSRDSNLGIIHSQGSSIQTGIAISCLTSSRPTRLRSRSCVRARDILICQQCAPWSSRTGVTAS